MEAPEERKHQPRRISDKERAGKNEINTHGNRGSVCLGNQIIEEEGIADRVRIPAVNFDSLHDSVREFLAENSLLENMQGAQ